MTREYIMQLQYGIPLPPPPHPHREYVKLVSADHSVNPYQKSLIAL